MIFLLGKVLYVYAMFCGISFQALESGSIAAAALDVFEVEPLPPDSRLWDLPNVFITTHKAGAGDSWVRRLAQLYADNLALYKSGQPLRNLVRL